MNALEESVEQAEADADADLIIALFSSRGAITIYFALSACILAGVTWWRTPIICLAVAAVYAAGFGRKWLQRLSAIALVCAAAYFADVIHFDITGIAK